MKTEFGIVVLKEGMVSVELLGYPCGTYEVEVGDYGWDDGDLFISTPKGRLKIRHLRELGDLQERKERSDD